MNKQFTIRTLLVLALVASTYGTLAQTMKVTLLGTGAPNPSIERFGPSILIEAGEQKLLIDCGRGAAQRLWQLKLPLGQIDALFLTHLHSDHVVGVPDLWLTSRIPAPYGRRAKPFAVYGPAGTQEMMQNLEKAYAWDTQTRSKETNKADSGIMVMAKDIAQGVVYEAQGVKVTAFTVDHADFIAGALGFRIDYNGRSVVCSGDTRYNQNLLAYAKGADVVIHEVAASNQKSTQSSPMIEQILDLHTSPEEAGKVFAQLKPRLAVYSHIVVLTADPAVPPPGPAELLSRTQKVYQGRLEVGEDLLAIEIGDSIVVSRSGSPAKNAAEAIR